TWRTEPLVDRALGRMAAAQTDAGCRGRLRPLQRRPLPPRHVIAALPSRQGAQAMHNGSGKAEASQPDEAADLTAAEDARRKRAIAAAGRWLQAPHRQDRASRWSGCVAAGGER